MCLARIQMQVLVQCIHDGGAGCNLICCFTQSFGAVGPGKVCKKTTPSSDIRIPSCFKNELASYTMLLMVPEPRETLATEHSRQLRFWILRELSERSCTTVSPLVLVKQLVVQDPAVHNN